ncbi:MAG: hypothetical protein HUJ16_08525 [Kangiella sp.]|nr:hypothetical protein [Kangiella sp.]
MKINVPLLIASIFFLSHPATADEKCYFYVTSHADEEFEVYQGESLKIIYSSPIRTSCDIYKTHISLQFNDALKAEYPKTHYYARNETVWGPFKSQNEIMKRIRKEKAEDGAAGFKIINFPFSYYSD